MNTLSKHCFSFVFALLITALAIPIPTMAQAPLGPYGTIPYDTANVAAGATTATLTSSNMLGILTATPTAAITYTTPTATALCALFPQVAASNAAQFSWRWIVKNTAASTYVITLAGGSGVTLLGTGTAAQNTVREFLITISGCSGTPAANLISLATGAF